MRQKAVMDFGALKDASTYPLSRGELLRPTFHVHAVRFWDTLHFCLAPLVV